ncbi:MAG: hypothetical protein JNK82_03535 [Myxococcaceae bacterium]|nr:hypothetical protein [Myxococcaceae bacterium]
MHALLLVALSQLADPLVPAAPAEAPAFVEPAPEAQPLGKPWWSIVTPIAGAVGGALGGRRLIAELAPNETDWHFAGFIGGSVIGLAAGALAGHFARQGSLAARIATVALYALSTGAVGYEVYRLHQDVQAICRTGINWSSGFGPR